MLLIDIILVHIHNLFVVSYFICLIVLLFVLNLKITDISRKHVLIAKANNNPKSRKLYFSLLYSNHIPKFNMTINQQKTMFEIHTTRILLLFPHMLTYVYLVYITVNA